MTREERAELTIRVAGVVFLALTLGGVFPVVKFFQMLRVPGASSTGALAEAIRSLAMAATGYGFVFWSGPVARHLRPQREEADTVEDELVRAGVFLLGVIVAFSSVLAAQFAWSGDPVTPAAWFALTAVVLLALPRPLISWLARRVRAGANEGLLGKLVACGIALLALRLLITCLGNGLSTGFGHPHHPSGHGMARLVRMFAGVPAQHYVAVASGLTLSLLALGFCGRIGAWFAGRAPQTSPAKDPAMGKRDWIVLGIVCVAVYWVLNGILNPPVLVALEPQAILMPLQELAVLALPILVVLAARPVARRLYPQEAEEPGSRARLAIALETAITVLVLMTALLWLVRAVSNDFYEVQDVVLMLLLLACKGDLARWCVRPTNAPDDPMPARASMMYPWLVLLGVNELLSNLPGVPGLVAIAFGWITPPVEMAVGQPSTHLLSPAMLFPLAGLVLVLAARPLARALAYRPLLHWLWRWCRGVGWGQRRAD